MTQDPPLVAYLSRRASPSAKLFQAPYPGRADLEAVLRLALRTPDHGKLEPWRVLALLREDLLRLAALGEARALALGGDAEKVEKGRGQFARSHAALVVLSSPRPAEKVPEREQVLSAGALCMNILHAAAALGWGANWLTGWVSHDPVFAAGALGAREGETVAGIIHLGTAAGPVPERPRPDLASVVQWGLS